MNRRDFDRLYNLNPEAMQRDIELKKLAEKYHELCDAFDDAVCTAKNENGVSMPETNEQYQAINRNAQVVRDSVIKQAQSKGFSKKDIVKAIQNYSPS